MVLESLLAYLHFIAIFTLIVFLTSEAALCRAQWLNAASLRRLAAIDRVYGIAALVVLATGFARTYWGVKGFGWYWHQPLLHLKVGLFVVIGLMSIKPTVAFIRWKTALDATGSLPGAEEIKSVRRWVMIQAHLLILIPLAAVFLARGVFTR